MLVFQLMNFRQERRVWHVPWISCSHAFVVVTDVFGRIPGTIVITPDHVRGIKVKSLSYCCPRPEMEVLDGFQIFGFNEAYLSVVIEPDFWRYISQNSTFSAIDQLEDFLGGKVRVFTELASPRDFVKVFCDRSPLVVCTVDPKPYEVFPQVVIVISDPKQHLRIGIYKRARETVIQHLTARPRTPSPPIRRDPDLILKAIPLADAQFATTVINPVQQAANDKQLTYGVNAAYIWCYESHVAMPYLL